MSVDHGVIPQSSHTPDFLRVTPGDVVAVEGETDGDDAWVAEVVFVEGSARNPLHPYPPPRFLVPIHFYLPVEMSHGSAH